MARTVRFAGAANTMPGDKLVIETVGGTLAAPDTMTVPVMPNEA
jgi:hypothetical protein